MEWLHKHQVTCSRALFRTFAELRQLRQDFAADPAMAEAAAESPAPGPCGDTLAPVTPPAGPRESAGGPEAGAARETDESLSLSVGRWEGEAPPEPVASARREVRPPDTLVARTEPRPLASATGSEPWAPRPGEVVEPDHLPPTDSEPAAIEPVAVGDAPTVTNEASGPSACGGSAPDGRGPAGPAPGPIDGPPGAGADGDIPAHPPGARPDDGARVATNEASSPPETERGGGDPIATNEASSGDGEVKPGAGDDSECGGPPQIPLAAGVGRSGPTEEEGRDARGEGPVGCSSRTVTAAACVPSIAIAAACAAGAAIAGASSPIAAIAGASASVLGEYPTNHPRAARMRPVRAPIGWVAHTPATEAEFPLIRPWCTFSPAAGEQGSRDASAERVHRRRAFAVRFRPAASGRGSG